MNVERQAYHGKSFICNHVHICCKENNTRLCSAVVEKTEELCPSLISEAREIRVKFDQPLKLFGACHFVYDSADYLDDEKIYKMGGGIHNLTPVVQKVDGTVQWIISTIK
ncbi:uncharacterized protein [Montipora capricornis]|uniref:uncharacterized protein n=1 Tax=Montipora capricornis TaxID=246305 RepID=UPI0035F1C1DC